VEECYHTSQEITAPLTGSLLQRESLDTLRPPPLLPKYRAPSAMPSLKQRAPRWRQSPPPSICHAITRGKSTPSWLTAYLSYLNGTELSADEFQDNLRLRFGLCPKQLPTQTASASTTPSSASGEAWSTCAMTT
jgi:hypothetical protein